MPALPQSAIRLLELAQDPSKGPADFAVPIESDPGLAAQVLRFVNSSYFGFSREIATVKLAITLVGVRTIKNFALWNAVFCLMPDRRCGRLDLKSLWQDSLRRALFARAAGRLLGLRDADEPFTAALLQDMAVPLLAKETPEVYATLLEARAGGKRALSTLEQQAFGWTHAQAASMITRHWHLPESFGQLVELHAQPERCTEDPAALVVALSSLLPPLCDPGWCELERLKTCYHQALPSVPPLPEMLARVDREYEEMAPALKLPMPGRSLTQSYAQATAEPAGASP